MCAILPRPRERLSNIRKKREHKKPRKWWTGNNPRGGRGQSSSTLPFLFALCKYYRENRQKIHVQPLPQEISLIFVMSTPVTWKEVRERGDKGENTDPHGIWFSVLKQNAIIFISNRHWNDALRESGGETQLMNKESLQISSEVRRNLFRISNEQSSFFDHCD